MAKKLLDRGAAEILNEVYGCDTFNTDEG